MLLILSTSLCTHAFQLTAISQTATSLPPKVFLFGRGLPELLTILRDLPSSTGEGMQVTAYLRGGKPSDIVFKAPGKRIEVGLELKINNVSLGNLKLNSYMLELGGFYTKATYYTSEGSVAVHTMPLYTAKSIYISVCPSLPSPLTAVGIVMSLNTSYTIASISENSVAVEVNGTRASVWASPKINSFRNTDKGIELGVLVSSGMCTKIAITFGEKAKVDDDTLVYLIDLTASTFSNILRKYPLIQTMNYEMSSLYYLSLFNTINLIGSGGLEDDVIGVLPVEMASYLYISMLAGIPKNCNLPVSRPSTADEGYANAIALYMFLARGICSEHVGAQHLLSVLNALANASASKNAIELAKVYKALSTVELVATLKGYSDIALQARDYRNAVAEKMHSFYTGINRYLTRLEEPVLSYEDIVEAIAIASYDVPNSESHIEFMSKVLSSVDVFKISMHRPFIVDAIEALTRYGYADQALKLVKAYFNSVVSSGTPCIDFYRAVLKGFLGINAAPEGISIAPQLPLALANTSLSIGRTTISYVNWGSEIEAVYVDGFLQVAPVVSWSKWFTGTSVVVVLRRRPLFEMCITVMRRGAPLANETAYVFTSSGFTSIGTTNSSGSLCTLIPCGDKWVYISVKGVLISLGLGSTSCKSLYAVIDLEKELQDLNSLVMRIEGVARELKALNTSLSQLATSMQTIKTRVHSLEQNMTNVAIQMHDAYTWQSFLKRILYISLGLATLSTALALLALQRRK